MQIIEQKNLVRILKDNKKNNSDTRFVFLLGAGASVQSDIPSANNLAKEWLSEVKEDLANNYDNWKDANSIDEEYPAKKYTEVFRKRFEHNPKNGYETLQKLMEDKQPSIGYTILSQILENTKHNFVITTNFDSLIEDALFLFTSKRPLVCGHESLANFIQLNSTRPTVIKAHRDILLDPYNTPDNTCELESSLENALKPILANSPLIVIGYGGNDESIMNFLKKTQRQDIYWCMRNTESIPENIKEVLKENDKIVRIDGFDELMVDIHSNVYKFDSIESLASDNDDDSLIVKNAYEKVATYKKELERFRIEVENSSSDEFKENSKSILPSWWDYQLEINKTEDIEEKLRIYIEANDAYPNTYQILCNWGINLLDFAKIKNNEELITQGLDKIKQASILNPKNDLIVNNYGSALHDLALSKKDKTLLEKALDKYTEASKLNSKNSLIINNIGNVLSSLAEYNNSQDLFYQAFNKFEEASNLNPENSIILYNWANNLLKFAKLNNDEYLIKKALDKYEQAAKSDPENFNILNNWSNGLVNIAELNKDKNSLKKALANFEKLSLLYPENYIIFKNWGYALLFYAKISNDKYLYIQADEKYNKAFILNPDDYTIFANWGTALLYLGKLDNRKETFNKAQEKLSKSIDFGDCKYNLACLYSITNKKNKALQILEESLIGEEVTKDFVLKDEDWSNLLYDEDFLKVINKYD